MPIKPKDLVRRIQKYDDSDDDDESISSDLYTWDEVPDFDNCYIPGEQSILEEVMKDSSLPVCPYLKILDRLFHYCSKGIPDIVAPTFEPYNPIMISKQSSLTVQLYCRGEFENCAYYKNSLPVPWISAVEGAPIKGEKVVHKIENQKLLPKKL